VGVRATIERAIQENVSLVLDGIHLLPDLLGLDPYRKDALFLWTNLFLTDTQAYADRFRTRGKTAAHRPRHRYVEHLDQILKLQDHILDVGEVHGVPAFENVDLDDTLQSLSLHIMDSLRTAAKKLRANPR
jgi:2-phosphoglycerate kinase